MEPHKLMRTAIVVVVELVEVVVVVVLTVVVVVVVVVRIVVVVDVVVEVDVAAIADEVVTSLVNSCPTDVPHNIGAGIKPVLVEGVKPAGGVTVNVG